MTIDETQVKQNKFADKLDDLRAHPGRGSKYIDLKVRVSKNLKKIYDRWLKIVDGVKTGILPFSKIDGTKTDSGDEQGNILDTPKQERFNDFLNHIKEEEKIIDATLFRNIFDYDTPDKMLQTLYSLRRVDSYNQKGIPIEDTIINFGDIVKKTPKGVEKNEGKKILKIVGTILDFCLNEQNKKGQGLKRLTPSQMLRRFSMFLAN